MFRKFEENSAFLTCLFNFTDRVSMGGNAIASIRVSTLTFESSDL